MTRFLTRLSDMSVATDELLRWFFISSKIIAIREKGLCTSFGMQRIRTKDS